LYQRKYNMKKRIVIVGGSSGLGEALAKSLKDHDLFLLSRNIDKVNFSKLQAKRVKCDITSCPFCLAFI